MNNGNGNHKKIVMLRAHDFMYPNLDPRVYREAKSLVRNGYEVSVVCWGNVKKDAPSYEQYENINVYRIFQSIPYYTTPLFWRFPAYGMYILKSIRKCLRLRPDFIHCHDLDTLAIGATLKVLARKPLIFDAAEDFPSMPKTIWLRQIMRLYEKLLIRFADKIIAAEELYAPIMRRHYGISPIIILNLPELDKFNPFVDPSSVIKRYGLNEKIVVSQIGALGEDRGLFEILESLKYVKCDRLKCLLVGKTTKEQHSRIEETIRKYKLEDKVILTGAISFGDIPGYYKASTITIALLYPTPKYILSVPTKLYESLAMGVPVLAADLPHIKKIVDTYEVGLCADSQSPGDIAAKLNILISNEEKRDFMGRRGLDIANKRFNWSQSEKALLKLYSDVNK